jgi:UDP-2,3-diacylglucosamine pyrophosphatase LpxH
VIIDISEPRLAVISDLHLGSPASTATWRLVDFLEQVRVERWPLCINGDGFDILQSRLPRFLADASPVIRRLRRLREDGIPVYYTLGNHDVALEHTLDDLPLIVAPFLNVMSGSQRIRIEHGHLNEPTYARHPGIYEFGGRLGRTLLFFNADVYRLWSSMQLRVDRRRRDREGTETYPHYRAAATLFERGFDAAIFGHTHLPEIREFEGGIFVNSGSWMKGGEYVLIQDGDVSLHTWKAGRPSLTANLLEHEL